MLRRPSEVKRSAEVKKHAKIWRIIVHYLDRTPIVTMIGGLFSLVKHLLAKCIELLNVV